jgi:hypothetical protein
MDGLSTGTHIQGWSYMTTRRSIGPKANVVAAAASAVVWAMVAGCSSQPKPHTQHTWPEDQQPAAQQEQTQPTQTQTDPAHKVDQMEASAGPGAGSADALARKAEAYSRELSPLINQRAAAQSAPTVTPAQPSGVQWMDPAQFRIGGDFSRDALDTAPHANSASVKPVLEVKPPNADKPASPGLAPDLKNSAVADASDGAPHFTDLQVHAAAPTDALADKLSRRVKDYPRDVCAQLEFQLLQFLLDEQSPQMPKLSSLPSEDCEVITALLDGLTNFRNALRADNNMLLSKKIKPILDMAERLRAQADLTIPTIALCTNVVGFGNYDPIDPARFAAGVEHPAVVYCEIANFTSNLNDKQMWETRLTWDMTLYTEQGISVWSDKTQSLSDMSRVRRHDFFVVKKIMLPKNLTIGRYLLKVSLVDTQSNRVSEATVPMVIVAE